MPPTTYCADKRRNLEIQSRFIDRKLGHGELQLAPILHITTTWRHHDMAAQRHGGVTRIEGRPGAARRSMNESKNDPVRRGPGQVWEESPCGHPHIGDSRAADNDRRFEQVLRLPLRMASDLTALWRCGARSAVSARPWWHRPVTYRSGNAPFCGYNFPGGHKRRLEMRLPGQMNTIAARPPCVPVQPERSS